MKLVESFLEIVKIPGLIILALLQPFLGIHEIIDDYFDAPDYD